MLDKIKKSRVFQLLYKFCSVKGLFVLASTYGLFTGRISEYTFTLAWAVFIGLRELYKHLKGEKNTP